MLLLDESLVLLLMKLKGSLLKGLFESLEKVVGEFWTWIPELSAVLLLFFLLLRVTCVHSSLVSIYGVALMVVLVVLVA